MALQIPDFSGALDAATPLRTIAAQQQAADESKQRMQEGALNIQKLKMALEESKREHDENDKIRQIIQGGAQSGEDPQVTAKKVSAINPDKGAALTSKIEADTLLQQSQAEARFRALNGSVAPGADVATPQTTTAPIQTSLTDASQMSQPQASAPGMTRVEAPLPTVTQKFVDQPDVIRQPQSARQLTLADEARQTFAARLEAQKKAAEGVIIPEGATLHREGLPDVVGAPKQSEIEKEAAPWLAKNPGKTLDDYVAYKATLAQPHDAFQESYLPAYLRAHGITTASSQAQKDAMTLRANEDYKQIARDPVMQEILRGNAENARTDRSFAAADAQLKDIRKPIDAEAANISQAKALLAENNPGANSLAAPAIIKAVVGGVGSGVRITTPEINAINGGRGKIDDFKSWLSSWSLDPQAYRKLLPDQKVWLNGVMDKLAAKIQAKQSVISAANQKIISVSDVNAHRQAVKDLNDSLEAIDGGSSTTKNPFR